MMKELMDGQTTKTKVNNTADVLANMHVIIVNKYALLISNMFYTENFYIKSIFRRIVHESAQCQEPSLRSA